MQVLRQGLTAAFQRSNQFACSTMMKQQIRWEGSDPRSSTSSENHKDGSNLNKSKGGNKKQKSNTTDDTNQPGVNRKDWSRPNQVANNDPQYGKGGSPANANEKN